MAFPPFWNKIFRDNDGNPNTGPVDSALSIAATVGSLTPLGIGAAVGIKQVRDAGGILTAGAANDLASTGKDVGTRLRHLKEMQTIAAQRRQTELASMIMSGGSLQMALQGNVEQRKAMIASVLATMDDSTDVSNIRNQLVGMMGSIDDLAQDDLRRLSEAVRTSFENMSGQERQTFEKLFNSEYLGASKQLAAPVDPLVGTGIKYKKVEEGVFSELTGRNRELAQSRLERFKKAVGSGRAVELGTLTEHGGPRGTSYYARTRVGNQWLTYNLHSARFGGEFGTPVLRFGSDLSTTYFGSKVYGDAQRVKQQFLDMGVSPTREKVSSSLRSNSASSAFMGVEEYNLRFIEKELRGAENITSKNIRRIDEFGRKGAIGMERGSRPGTIAHLDPIMNRHLLNAAEIQSSVSRMSGFETLSRNDQKQFAARLAIMEGSVFTGQASPELTRMGSLSFGTISTNIGASDPFTMARDLGFKNEVIYPATARLRQLTGRPEFLTAINPVSSTLGRGRSIDMYRTNLGFTGNMVTGGINTAVLMDLKGGAERLGLSEGMAYFGPKTNITTQFTKTVLNPFDIKGSSTSLLNDLVERKRLSMAGAGPANIKIEGEKAISEFFNKYRGVSGGAILGELDRKMVEIPRYSDLKALNFELVEETMAMGRKRYHISGYMTRAGEQEKLFGQMGKVTTMPLTGSMTGDLMGRMGLDSDKFFRQTGLSSSQLMISEGAMLNKAAGFLGNQMVSGVGLVGTKSGMEGIGGMEGLYGRISRGVGAQNIGAEATALGQQSKFLLSVARESARALGGMPGVSAQAGGYVFGGIMQMGIDSKYGLNRGSVEKAIREGYGDKGERFFGNLFRQAEQGIALGAGTFVSGTPTSTYRSTLGSMEPRFFQFLSHKLRNTLGLSVEATSDFMTGIMARKGMATDQIQALKTLGMSSESMAGVRGIFTDSFYKDLVTPTSAGGKGALVDWKTFTDAAGGSEAKTREFLSKHKHGFMLNLGDRATGVGGVSRGFAGANQIYIGGGDLIEGLRGAEIRKSGETIRVQHEYIRRVADFAANLQTIQSAQFMQTSELAAAQRQAGSFRSAIADVFTSTWKASLAGKLSGSTYMTGAGVSLYEGPGTNLTAGISKGRADVLRSANQFAKGGAVFATGQGFLDAMREYMGGAKNEMIAGTSTRPSMNPAAASRAAKKETAKLFESFFLGMEGGASGHQGRLQKTIGKFGGVEGIIKRDPILGPGHTAISSVYRYDFGQEDKFFKRFTETAVGNRALENLERNVKDKAHFRSRVERVGGFAAMAELPTTNAIRGARLNFFSQMAENISHFAGQGKGRMIFPDMVAEVHYTHSKESLKINFSKAAGMIGDFDGDFYQLFVSNKRQGEMLKDASIKSRMRYEDLAFSAKTTVMMEEAKAGLKVMAKDIAAGAMSGKQFILEGALKEFYAKEIGSLDIALDSARLGVMHSVEGVEGKKAGQSALALLAVVEEVAAIKSKKTPVAIEFAHKFETAFAHAFRNKGDTSLIEALFKQSVFRSEAGIVSSVDVSGLPSREMQENVRAIFAEGTSTQRREAMGALRKGIAAASDIGLDRMKSQREMMGVANLDSGNSLKIWNHIVRDGESIRGSMMRDDYSKVRQIQDSISAITRRVDSAAARMDSKLLGPLMLGALGTIALGSAVGEKGYSDTPFLQPGEISDWRVSSAIAQGNLNRQVGQEPEAFRGSEQINMVDRPISIGSTYLEKRNSYQIRGQAMSLSGGSEMSNFIASMGGRSSVILNDTRRPITPNYIDRIIGE